MAIRGKVKDIKSQPMGRSASGTVTDTAAKVDYQFEQPFGIEMGLGVGSIVQFELVKDSTGASWAVALDPVDKGSIDTLDPASGTGTITDKAGTRIPFVQNCCTELGLAAGSKVKFVTVTVDGKNEATSVRIA